MCDGSCNTVEDPFDRICVPNKMEIENLKMYNMIKGINKSGELAKHISGKWEYEFDGRKCKVTQK